MATYRVLTLDGGGIRGLVTAILLRRLCARFPGWLEKVDFIAGTSSGGMIALALAHGLEQPTKEKTLDEIIRTFESGDETFGRALPWWLGGGVFFSKYQSEARATRLQKFFKDGTLAQLTTNVLVAAFDLDNADSVPTKRMWKPKLFHNLPHVADQIRDASDCNDGKQPIWKVAMATTAAPILFPTFDGYIDGGVYSNNPSMCALAQLLDRRYNPRANRRHSGSEPGNDLTLSDVFLVSVGAGLELKHLPKLVYRGGVIPWAFDYVKLTMDGTVGIADYQSRTLLGCGHYRRIEPAFRPGESIGLDDVAKIPRLRQIAEAAPIELDAHDEDVGEFLRIHWMEAAEPAMA